MGCLLAEIGMLIFGVIALATGKLKLSKNKVVQGPMARVLGLVAMAPLPLAFAVGIAVALINAANGAREMTREMIGILTVVEVGIGLLAMAIVFGVGFAIGKPEQPANFQYSSGGPGNAPYAPPSNNPYQAPYQQPPQQGGPFDPFRQ